ncbi:MAG: AAA family ATPase [Candidatus Methylomirabilales bacterium]
MPVHDKDLIWEGATDLRPKIGRLIDILGQVIVGKPEVIQLALVALVARGHLLIEDVPGVGKTTLAHALAKTLGCSFQRVQFTSDLLPSDLLGVSVLNSRTGEFEFKPGPIFAQIVLADEINRASPKTQSSLLEAMNDFQISIDHHTYPLSRPFMVLATQNPMEHHGTHPLPESQLDRFLLRIRVGYPSPADERRILSGPRAQGLIDQCKPVLSIDEVLLLQRAVEMVRVDESLLDYMLALIQATRRARGLTLGASPRGSLALYRTSQALAFLQGRGYVVPDDVKRVAIPTLAHRVILTGAWDRTAGLRDEAEEIVRALLDEIPVPR